MRIRVNEDGLEMPDGHRVACALGRGGIRAEKQEGDGVTPAGVWPIRRVLYRPDRVAEPRTRLPITPIREEDGWCDDPADPAYNQPVTRPYTASHEAMWREDGVYDLVAILGHNDDPPEPGRGSAIFLHVARADYGPTEGCVALALPDLLMLLEQIEPDSALHVGSNQGAGGAGDQP